MNIDRLRALLPPELRPDAERLWETFHALFPDQDANEFIAWLHDGGHLTAAGLRDALASVDVTITTSDPLPDSVEQEAPSRRHTVLGLLGKGAMGEVVIARDRALNRNVAVKKMIPRFAKNRVGNTRFQTEVQITAQLDHPSIIPVYSFERGEEGAPSYSMKLVRGRTLTEYLQECKDFYKQGGKPDPDHSLQARLDIFLQICNAMAYAHSRGVIHRDLKPDNVMIGVFHEVIVMDWGVAKLVGGGELPIDPDFGDTRAHVTQIGAAVGTPTYMSPEQAQGRNEELTAKSDQYALGLLLYEMVVLKRALSGPTAPAVLIRAAHGQKDPMLHLANDPIPRELQAIILKATAIPMDDRYETTAELANDIRRYMRNEEILAAPDGAMQSASRWVSHHRELTLSIGFGLVLLLIFGGALATVGSGLALERERVAALQREERLEDLLSVVSAQSHRIDITFQTYETLLARLTGASEVILATPQAPHPYWLPSDIAAGNGPADLAPAPYYKSDFVSLAEPDLVLAPGVEAKSIEPRLHQLVALRDPMWRVIRRTLPQELDEGTVERQIREKSAPVMWSYIATNDGVIVGIPGVWRYPEAYDPRVQDWYIAGMNADGPMWHPASLDESGMGLLLTCTIPIRDADGQKIGLAALDIGIEYVIKNLIEPPGIAAPVEAYLVDAAGRTVVQSSLSTFDAEPTEFPYPEVLQHVRAGEDVGRIENKGPNGKSLLAWSHLDNIGWTYVVMGDRDALLAN